MGTNELGKFCTALLAFGVLAFLTLAGCSGAVPVKPGSASYSLKILLEKNLDSKADYLYLEFLRNDSAFVGAFVIVDHDTIRTKASGRADTSYLYDKWSHGQTVSLKAVDTAKAFVYQTSVIIPDSFGISNVFPNTRIWQPNANPRVEWTASAGATNYFAAIQARGNGSPSRGQSAIAGSTQSYTFTPTAFYNPQNNELVRDVYYIHVVAYAPTMVERPDANYKMPTSPPFPLTVDTKQIAGAVAAAVVSARDTIVVSPSL